MQRVAHRQLCEDNPDVFPGGCFKEDADVPDDRAVSGDGGGDKGEGEVACGIVMRRRR